MKATFEADRNCDPQEHEGAMFGSAKENLEKI